jgi:transposase-like protein
MHSTSSEPPTDTTIIRSGSDGRLRYSQAQRTELLEAFDRSGLSAMAFARQHGISYQTFIAWLRKRRQSGGAPQTGVPAFAEVLLQEPSPGPGTSLRIVLSCGTAMEIPSRAALPLALEILQTLRR